MQNLLPAKRLNRVNSCGYRRRNGLVVSSPVTEAATNRHTFRIPSQLELGLDGDNEDLCEL